MQLLGLVMTAHSWWTSLSNPTLRDQSLDALMWINRGARNLTYAMAQLDHSANHLLASLAAIGRRSPCGTRPWCCGTIQPSKSQPAIERELSTDRPLERIQAGAILARSD
jgi:hypothetical protein